MDINNAMYCLKKTIKRIESGNYDVYQISQTLLDLSKFLFGLKMENEGYELRGISKEIASGHFNTRSIVSKLEHILTAVRKIKEKTSVMRQRECHAVLKFSKNNKTASSKVSEISKYDVILAPTQGGFHYCVVTEVIPNHSVKCYPMTTADTSDLDKLGCKYYPLSGLEGQHKQTVLTTAYTTVPYHSALNCFVERFQYSEELNRAVEFVQNNSVISCC